MAQPDYQKYLGACSELCYEAGAIAVTYSQDDSNWNIETKSDQSPVTAVDKELNDLIVGKLSTLFPETLVVGEESANELERGVEEGLVFFVDPIDGTKEFIKKNGEWAVQIGLTHDGVPVLGVVYQPTKDKLWYGVKGQGSFLVEGKGKVAKQLRGSGPVPRPISELTMVHSQVAYPDIEQIASKAGISNTFRHGSFGLKMCLCAEGAADIYINLTQTTSFWDSTGPCVIVEEAGNPFYVMDEGGNVPHPLRVSGRDTSHKEMLWTCPSTAGEDLHKLILER